MMGSYVALVAGGFSPFEALSRLLEARTPGTTWHGRNARPIIKYWYNHDGSLYSVPHREHHLDYAFNNSMDLDLSPEQQDDVDKEYSKHSSEFPRLPPISSMKNNTRVTVMPHNGFIEFHHYDRNSVNLGHAQDIIRKMGIPNHWDAVHVFGETPMNIMTTVLDTSSAKNFRELQPWS